MGYFSISVRKLVWLPLLNFNKAQLRFAGVYTKRREMQNIGKQAITLTLTFTFFFFYYCLLSTIFLL